ncbi:MAG: ubiquinol-cytochrome c reductase cytochrome b subunit, partial [Nocardioides sp.]|nr:ubiquinol-cytochrome c reductase cytochrome b subunit [Nocardioides sp.]
QWPGPGRTEQNVVGFPMLPVYAAKAGGFFFMVFGVIALMGGLLSINPVWKFGPYDPTKVTAGSQPDWYMGWPDGLLRIIPTGWESVIFGYTISWNVMIPILIVPPLMLVVLMLLPFIEAWITGDKRDHHLLQRPRNAPTRTAVMVSLMTFYGLAWAAGGNDLLAITFDLSINQITYFMRVMVFLGPAIAFFVTRRWCISLQRHDNEKLLHGYETGIIMRSAEGGYTERHLPINETSAYTLTARDRDEIYSVDGDTDANGVAAPGSRVQALRAKLSKASYAHNVQKPTAEELAEAHAHAHHDHELEAGDDHSTGHELHGSTAQSVDEPPRAR